MNRFHITAADLEQMTQVVRVSSYQPDKLTWTELAVYFRDRHDRPWVGVVEGRTDALDMSNRFQAMAGGTIDRVMNWFEPSNLRDQLATALEEACGNHTPHDVARDMAFQQEQRRGGRIPIMEPGDRLVLTSVGQAYLDAQDGLNVDGVKIPVIADAIEKAIEDGAIAGVEQAVDRILPRLRSVGITTDSFGEALRWLYPDAATDSARTTCLERDFGMPARTARRALAVEDGGVIGEPGAWVNMFLIALRFFDRELWVAGGCSATIASVEG